jgi:hypothetical protein
MRFCRAIEAYHWYRTKRYQVDHAGVMPRSLFKARGFEKAVAALVDIEKALAGLSRRERRALRDNTLDFSEAYGKFERALRDKGYLYH